MTGTSKFKSIHFFIAFIILISIFFQSPNVIAQNKILSPEEFLGYPLGSRFTSHHKVVEYYNHLASNSPQVVLEQYGESYEGRPLLLSFISTTENLQNLENIRTENLKRAGLLEGKASGNGPVILWFSYNVHGNESVSTEAALATIFSLINPKETEKQEWLKNSVVIIDPVVNPDGRERYVNFYKQFSNKVPNPNPDSKEHHEPWPGGRANHYLFDLNRDWAWQTQIESQQRLKIYNAWLPHVHVDFHEQGYNDPYYFAPAAEPLHEVITPWQRNFQEEIGRNHAKYFDSNSWLYFTKEHFDLLYPSYGDTYPVYNGAIGMTYEQGGSGRAGLAVITAEKDTLTLKDRIKHHYTTGISTIEISSKNASKLVQEFETFFSKSINNPPSVYKSYVIKNNNNSGKIADLLHFLDNMDIQYGHASPVKAIKGYQFSSKSTQSFSVQENDIVISAFQPKSVLLQVLFDPAPKLTDSITYDITSWAIPFMYDVEAYATTSRVKVGKEVQPDTLNKSVDLESAYAYISDWNNIQHLKFLSNLLAEDIKVRYTTEPFELEGKKFNAGSLIITRSGNQHLGSRFDDIVKDEARKLNINLTGASTGMVGKGKDFGSSTVRMIHAPEVAIVGGRNTSSLSFGELWHYFEQEINYPVTVLDTEYLQNVDLSAYDVLIFPGGNYQSILSEDFVKTLNLWVSNGGRLILIEDALSSFAGKEGFGLKEVKEEQTKDEEEKVKEEVKLGPADLYKNRNRKDISNYALGGIYKISLDNSHPLAFGYPDYYYTLKNNAVAYNYLDKGWNVGYIKDKKSLMSGFVGYKVQDKLNDALIFGVQDSGQGAIIYLADNPLFRSFWYNGKLIFGNAVFMVGQ